MPNIQLSKSDCPAVPNFDDTKMYQQLIGSLMYIAGGTRPDIAYAVSACSQFMSNPGPTHIAAAKHILLYLKGTQDIRLTYSRQGADKANVIEGYVNADHATDKDDRKSVGGFVLMLNRAAFHWASCKIKVVAVSSFESEWHSASVCAVEVTTMRRMLEELGFKQSSPTVLHEDNMACIYASSSDRDLTNRSKHIEA